jgi:hypothetical protein
MHFSKRNVLVAIAALCSALLYAGTISAGAATIGSVASYKAATDTDPHLPLTPYQQKMLASKEKAVADAFSGKASTATINANLSAVGVTSASALAAASTSSSGLPASDSVAKNQTPQKTSYWCGPASVHEALGQLHREFSQAILAPELGTTTAGTAWSGGPTSTGHPVPDVLNKHQSYFYIPEPMPTTPSDSDVSDYKTYLTYDIWLASAPVIGDAWTTPGSEFRLVGHPSDRTIYHWFDIYGYRISGGTTYTKYEDSVHNAESVGWHDAVPAYSELPSHQIAHIVGGRGYVW